MPEESELTFALDGGIVTTALEDIIQAPQLRESDNTRLSVLRGSVIAAPAPKLLAALPVGSECAGIIPAGRVDSSVAFLSKAGGNTRRIAGTDQRVLESILQPPATQNGYRPTEIASAGVVSGVLEFRTPVVCVHQGLRVFASMRYTSVPNEVGVFITALDAQGRVVVTPQLAFVVDTESSPFILLSTLWLGLTSHATDMRIWYTRDGQVRRRTLSISGLNITVGSEVNHSTTLVLFPVFLDVAGSDGGDTAFLVHSNAGPTQTYLDKVDVIADTYTRATLASVLSGPVAVSYFTGATHPYVALTYHVSGGWFRAVFRADTFAEVFHQTVTPTEPDFETAVQFLVDPDGTEYAVFAISRRGTITSIGSGADDPPFVLFHMVGLTSGSLIATAKRVWMRLHDRGVTIATGDLERLPFFTLSRDYEFAESDDLEAAGFIPDPSREMYSVVRGPGELLHVTPIARFGVDLASLCRVPPNMGPAHSAVDGRRAIVVYQQEMYEYGARGYGNVTRFVEIDFTAKQPRYALDNGGVAIIAAAQPATWDGREVVEAGPLHQPRIRGYADGGTGDDLDGTYIFRVQLSWRDAAGQIHRSAPSLPYQVDGTDVAPKKPRLYVTVPDTLRDGISQEKYAITLYQAGPITSSDPTETPSADFFSRLDYQPVDDGVTWAFTVLDDDPNPNFAQTILNTTGQSDEELPASAPPPLWDVAPVGLRIWGIHAELRRRVVCTKKLVEGIAPEWNNDVLYIDLPAAAGNLVAVVELDGKPLFFGQHGVYVLDGDGPDNTGNGSYGDPRCIAQVQCSSRESVVRFPGGVLFQSGARFAVIGSGGALQYVDEIDASAISSFAIAVVLPREQEVVLVPRTADAPRAYVLNHVLNRWSRWPAWPLFGAFALATRTRALGFDTAGHRLIYIDVDVPGATVVRQKTGWMQPAGPQGSCNIPEIIVQGVYKPGFTLRIEARQDFDDAGEPAFVDTYSEAQLLEACNGRSRFTLRVALQFPISRALLVELTATSSSAAAVDWQPVAVTIPLGISPGQLRRHVAAGMK